MCKATTLPTKTVPNVTAISEVNSSVLPVLRAILSVCRPQALAMAMRTSTRREGNLIVSVKNCDTSYNDETLLNVANATGEYTLDLQVSQRSGSK